MTQHTSTEGLNVTLGGEMTLAFLAELQPVLVSALESASTVTLDLTQTTEMDLGSLQLIFAARRAFAARGKRLDIRDSHARIWSSIIAAAGFPAESEGRS